MVEEHWKVEPEAHDYPAAIDYLSLLVAPKTAKATVRALREAQLMHRKAKDLIRASGLRLLDRDDPDIRAVIGKVASGERLSPVLLVRGSLGHHPLLIADGYHRVCASYHVDEDEDIPCRLVDLASR